MWLPQKATPAMTSERSPLSTEPRSHPPSKLAISLDSLVRSWCESPATRTILLLLPAPAASEKSRRGRRHTWERSCNSASLARPSCAGAVTETLIARPPSAVAAIPRSPSDLARGDRRITTRTPSRVGVIGPSSKIFEHQIAQEIQQQDQNHRRNVDPAEIREEGSDRPQCWFGQPPQHVPHRRHDTIVPVDDAEGEEPAQYRLGDQ